MKNKITCSTCGEDFNPTQEQIEFIKESKDKGMTFMVLECGVCFGPCSYDPTNAEIPETIETLQYRCPCTRCTGWVVEIGDFWGCGQCGNSWKLTDLYEAISEMTSSCLYRNSCYAPIENGGYLPSDNEPENYDERVEQEN